MVPREVENMERAPITPNEDDRTMPKRPRQETTATTSEPMQMLSITDHKKSNKRPYRYGNHHGSIKSHWEIFRRFNNQSTGKSKVK